MHIRRAMPVIRTEGSDEARAFYEGFLGFRVAMDEDGMLMFASTSTHESARAAGLEIVRELRDEPWGIRRFFVRDPSGRTLNIRSSVTDRPPTGTALP